PIAVAPTASRRLRGARTSARLLRSLPRQLRSRRSRQHRRAIQRQLRPKMRRPAMHAWTRRGALGLSLGAAACTTMPPSASAPSLTALARAKGMRFGTAMGQFPPTSEFDDAGYRQLVLEQCGVLVAENEHKWPTIHPAPGRFNFEPADRMMA